VSVERVLFLDIDGVLNHAGSVRREHLPGLAGWLDPAHLDALNRVVLATNARIVVSSSWRVGRTLEDVRTLLCDFGVVAPIIDATPVAASRRRDEEILAWLARHPEVQAYAGVDDELRVADDSPLAPHLVGTSMAEGLTLEHVAPLVHRLSLPYRAPWVASADVTAFAAPPRHVLHGRELRAVARRGAGGVAPIADAILFELDGAGPGGPLAVVPVAAPAQTRVYATRWRFEEEVMLPDALAVVRG
jgi:hypothetical protein